MVKWRLTGVLSALLIVFALALHQSTRMTFWIDELLSLAIVGGGDFARESVLQIILNVGADRAWPPLSYLLLALWGNFAGWSEVAGRYLSIMFGVLSAAMFWRLAYDLAVGYSRPRRERIALMAALLCLFSALHITYWSEMRGYTLYLLLTLTSVWGYWHLLHQTEVKGWQLTLLGLSVTALCYTHYIATMTAVAIGLYHLLFCRKSPHFVPILFVMVVSALLFGAWGTVTLAAVENEIALTRSLSLGALLAFAAYAFGNGLVPLAGLPLMGLAVGQRRAVRFVVFWLIVGLAVIAVFNQISGFLFHIRHVFGLIAPFVLLTAFGLDWLWQHARWLVVAVLMVWIGTGCYQIVQPDFLDSQPNQLHKWQLALVGESLTTLQACASSDDPLIFMLTADLRNDDIFYYTGLLHYFGQLDNPLVNLEALFDYRAADAQGIAEAATLGDWSTRLMLLTQNAATTWFIAEAGLPENQFTRDLEQQLATRYAVRSIVLETPATRITAYSHTALMCHPGAG